MYRVRKNVSPSSGYLHLRQSTWFCRNPISCSRPISTYKNPTLKEQPEPAPSTDPLPSTTHAWPVRATKSSTLPLNNAKPDVPLGSSSVNKTPNALRPISWPTHRLQTCCRLWGISKNSEENRRKNSSHRQDSQSVLLRNHTQSRAFVQHVPTVCHISTFRAKPVRYAPGTGITTGTQGSVSLITVQDWKLRE